MVSLVTGILYIPAPFLGVQEISYRIPELDTSLGSVIHFLVVRRSCYGMDNAPV